MLKAGLTGGLATGKTFVGRELAHLGCHVIQADALGHQVLEPAGAAHLPVIKHFGLAILTDGRIDRKKLADLVFHDPRQLEVLNGIVHPLVFALEDERLREIAAKDPGAIAVIEAAILIETGAFRRCEKVILTVCKPEQQIERAMARGLSEKEVRARLERQMPIEEKRRFADYIIDTSGTRESTVEQTRDVYTSLRSLTQ